MTDTNQTATIWTLDLDVPAKVWSKAPFPSKASRAKAAKAILAFVETLPEDATIADLRMELERWASTDTSNQTADAATAIGDARET